MAGSATFTAVASSPATTEPMIAATRASRLRRSAEVVDKAIFLVLTGLDPSRTIVNRRGSRNAGREQAVPPYLFVDFPASNRIRRALRSWRCPQHPGRNCHTVRAGGGALTHSGRRRPAMTSARRTARRTLAGAALGCVAALGTAC